MSMPNDRAHSGRASDGRHGNRVFARHRVQHAGYAEQPYAQDNPAPLDAKFLTQRLEVHRAHPLLDFATFQSPLGIPRASTATAEIIVQ